MNDKRKTENLRKKTFGPIAIAIIILSLHYLINNIPKGNLEKIALSYFIQQ